MRARNSPDNLCRGRAFTQSPLVAVVGRGLSLPIRLYSVTARFDKRLHIPLVLLNNDPNNTRQTFIPPLSLFLSKASVEHFSQSLMRDGSLAAMGAATPDSRSSSWRESFAPATLRFHRHRSLRIMTQKLFRFGHFGIPFL